MALGVGGVVVAAGLSAVAASFDALPLLLLGLVGLVAAVAAMRDPMLLLYLYCAAIPFNFALPPGPGGTVGRIAGVVFVAGYLLRRPDALRIRTIPAIGWLFVVWSLTSVLWSVHSDDSFSAWLSLAQQFGVLLLVASIVARRPETVRPALWAYSLSAAATSILAGVSFVGSDTITAGGRASAFTGQDPALFSSAIVAAAFYTMGEVQAPHGRRIVRLAALGVLAVCAAAIALSGTRSAWIAAIVAVLFWVAIRRERNQILALSGIVVAIGALALAVPGFGNFLADRTQYGLTGSGRTDIWIVGLGIFASAPLIGVGFGNFTDAFTNFAISQASGASAADGALFAGRAAHNTFLAVAVETGVIGALLLVGFLAMAVLRRHRGAADTMITVVLIGLFVQAFFLDLLFQKQLWLFLAIAFGLEASRRVDVVAAEGLAARARKALWAPALTPQRPRPPQWRGT